MLHQSLIGTRLAWSVTLPGTLPNTIETLLRPTPSLGDATRPAPV